jgi:hypothetical protein
MGEEGGGGRGGAVGEEGEWGGRGWGWGYWPYHRVSEFPGHRRWGRLRGSGEGGGGGGGMGPTIVSQSFRVTDVGGLTVTVTVTEA